MREDALKLVFLSPPKSLFHLLLTFWGRGGGGGGFPPVLIEATVFLGFLPLAVVDIQNRASSSFLSDRAQFRNAVREETLGLGRF